MMTHCYELPIRILLSREERDYVAHGLEVDLVAYGRTEKGALTELEEMIQAQMSYASQTNRPELVWHPAPEEFFKRWETAHQAALRGAITKDRPVKMATKATFVTFTKEEATSKQVSFHRAEDTALAKIA